MIASLDDPIPKAHNAGTRIAIDVQTPTHAARRHKLIEKLRHVVPLSPPNVRTSIDVGLRVYIAAVNIDALACELACRITGEHWLCRAQQPRKAAVRESAAGHMGCGSPHSVKRTDGRTPDASICRTPLTNGDTILT